MSASNRDPTPKLDIAVELLDVSLRCYFDTEDYYASLHLAGAAEEIFGSYLRAYGKENAFESTINGTIAIGKKLFGLSSKRRSIISVVNFAKNHAKHMRDIQESAVGFDAKSEAHDVLDRAISDYYQLMSLHDLEESPLIRRFNEQLTNRA